MPDPTKGTANHAADILIESPENARSQGFVTNLSIDYTLLSKNRYVNNQKLVMRHLNCDGFEMNSRDVTLYNGR